MKTAFTIITPNYISFAKTLGDSLLGYNPEYKFILCVIGKTTDLDKSISIDHFEVISIHELEDSMIEAMQQRYSLFELSCALKPYFAAHLFKKYPDIERLKYFDSDMMLFNSFDSSLEKDTSSIFLTPHFTHPLSLQETGHPNDSTMLHVGIFNGGFFEVRNTKEAMRFLTWWKDRLADCCYDSKPPYLYIYVDQSWLVLVPIYFKEVRIIENTGYNMAFYNLQERKLSKNVNQYLVNSKDTLVFFHFTGYKYYHHHLGSKLHPKYNYSNTEFLEEICTIYMQNLLQNYVELTSPQPVISNSDVQVVQYSSLSRMFDLFNSILEKTLNIKISRVN